MQSGNYYQNSLEMEVYSASPVELVRILYRAAIESVTRARLCLHSGDIEERGKAISRCQAIVTELASSLDRERGGGLSASLAEIYDFLQRQLQEAHLSQTEEPLSSAASVLSTLLEGWMHCENIAVEPDGSSREFAFAAMMPAEEREPMVYHY